MELFRGLLIILAVATSVSAAPSKAKRASGPRTSPPSGCLSVGSGHTYSTLSAAVSALGSGTSSACIFLYSGTYTEQVVIDYGGPLTLYGYTADVGTYNDNTVTITYNEGAVSGASYSGATVAVLSDNFNAYNINFANTYGKGMQALAMYASGHQMGFYGCSFTGYQDTLFAGWNYQYYSNCYISGEIDFIYGSASAWFGECTIAPTGAGVITANGRGTDDTSWFVIDSSSVEAASGVSLSGDVYLGRPWGILARVIYQRSTLGSLIEATGWTTMTTGATPTFEEYDNTGAGSSTASREYETKATAMVTKSELWPDGYSWIDTSY